MASQVAELWSPSSDSPEPLLASVRGPDLRPPPREAQDAALIEGAGPVSAGGGGGGYGDGEGDDEEDPWAATITYLPVSDETGDKETTCPGQRYTKEEVKIMTLQWAEEYINAFAEYNELCEEFLSHGDENARRPRYPLKVMPQTTLSCIEGGFCYHREYMTSDTSETASTLGLRTPQDMLQILALKLTTSGSYPISVYGTFAVRDDFEPLRNYVFNRPRDEPVTIQQDSFGLPLCSPCRGMYVLDRALLEVDLWVKKEGNGSMDEQLLSVFVEIGLRTNFNKKLTGQIRSGHCMLDMDFMFLTGSIEAVIQVFVLAEKSRHVKFSAIDYFDNEIVLFEGKHAGKGELLKHVVAVKREEKLAVRLELDNSLFEWTFKEGTVGAFSYPEASISKQFVVRVYFAPKDGERGPSRYLAWRSRFGKR
ncbi:hypothetical protein ACP4OV_014829 [Aristida adscensionis]